MARQALIEADAAAGAANAGLQGSSIFATYSLFYNWIDAVTTATGRFGGYVEIPGSMLGSFAPIAAVGPISTYARFVGAGFVSGPFPGQLLDAILGQLMLAAGQIASQQNKEQNAKYMNHCSD